MKKQVGLIIVLSLLAFTVGIAARHTFNSFQGKHPAYSIVWQATDYDAEGKGTLYYTETRRVTSTGKWHGVRRYADGKSEEMFAELGKGIFLKRGEKIQLLSEYTSQPTLVGEEDLRQSPSYLRTETILGLLSIVVKPANAPGNGPEFYRAPALGGEIIKTVINQEGGQDGNRADQHRFWRA